MTALSFASSSNTQIYFVPNSTFTADITERIQPSRKLFGSMNKQLLTQKDTVDIRRGVLSSDCCEYIAL
jgi:hypothetical protein